MILAACANSLLCPDKAAEKEQIKTTQHFIALASELPLAFQVDVSGRVKCWTGKMRQRHRIVSF